MPRGWASFKTTPEFIETSLDFVDSDVQKPRTPQNSQKSKESSKTRTKKPLKSKKSPKLPLLPAAPSPLQGKRSSKRQDFDPNAIRTYQELIHALEAEKVQITLADNIIVENDILINHDIAINFNGFSLISEDSHAGARVLDIRSGEVSLIGRGKIFAMGLRSVAIRAFGAISSGVPNYTTLTVDEGISLFAPDSYGILISPNLGVAYGLTVNFSGQIFARDGICLASGIHGYDPNLPVINLKSSAHITADETFGSAIEAAGYGEWGISTAQLRGAIGLNLSSGVLHLQHSQIISTGTTFNLLDSTTKDLEVVVDGGNYLSEISSVIAGSPNSLKSFIIKGGAELYSTTEPIATDTEKKITVRKTVNFRTDVEEFLANLAIANAPSEEPTLQPERTPVNTAPELSPEPTPIQIPESMPRQLPEPAMNPVLTQDEFHLPDVLSDDATDEQEIVLALTAEKVERPVPILVTPPKPVNPITNEQEAARLALSDAIADIRKLSAEDYDVGFSELEQAIRKSEKILMNPLASLADIRDAANGLLRAFDGLEERDEFSLSDEELDDLFYHGAVLGELTTEIERVKQEKKIKNATKNTPTNPQDILRAAQAEVGFTPVSVPSQPPKSQSKNPTPAPEAPATDFDVPTDVLNTISELNLSLYAPASQQILLAHLAAAQEILSDVNSAQNAVDEITASLLSDMAGLEKLNSPKSHHNNYQAKLSAPAPVTRPLIRPTMIDEMSPNSIWSQGITMIDEMTPFVTSVATREKMLRALQPRLKTLADLATNPFRKLTRSLSAGLHAGLRVYLETLHSSKN